VQADLKQLKAEHKKVWQQFENFQSTTVKQHAEGEVRRFEAEKIDLQIKYDDQLRKISAERRDHARVNKLAVDLDKELTKLRGREAEVSEAYAALSAAWAAEMTNKANAERAEKRKKATAERQLAKRLQQASDEASLRMEEADEKEQEAEAARERAAERVSEAETRAELAEKVSAKSAILYERKKVDAAERATKARAAAAIARKKATDAEKAAAMAMAMQSDAERVCMLQERQTERAKATAARLAEKVRHLRCRLR
jgi:hypothetical protein